MSADRISQDLETEHPYGFLGAGGADKEQKRNLPAINGVSNTMDIIECLVWLTLHVQRWGWGGKKNGWLQTCCTSCGSDRCGAARISTACSNWLHVRRNESHKSIFREK